MPPYFIVLIRGTPSHQPETKPRLRSKKYTPENRCWWWLNFGYWLPSAPPGSLIGRIGTDGQPFAIAGGLAFKAQKRGELFLATNDTPGCYADNFGEVTVNIQLMLSRGDGS